MPAVGYLLLAVTYAVGGFFLGVGLYILFLGTFPGWWKEWILRPVVRATPGVARLQGLTAIGLGASVVVIGLTMFVSALVGGLLAVIAILCYLVGAAIFAYSIWLSRKPAPGAKRGDASREA